MKKERSKLISSLAVDAIPCFGSAAKELSPLTQLTFLYGPNGSGKSSIAKALRSHHQNQSVLVELFDKELMERLLKPDQRIPGVFVIRDGSPDVQARIEQLLSGAPDAGGRATLGEIELAEREVTRLTNSIESSQSTISDARSALREACWIKRQALPEVLQQAFTGFLSNKKANLERVLEIQQATTSDNLKDLTELCASYEALADESSDTLAHVPAVPVVDDLTTEQKVLLNTSIKSRDNTTFGEFVTLLGNSDWVHQGHTYLELSDGKCPFCQQEMSDDITESLDRLFDDVYESQVAELKTVLEEEIERSRQIQEIISVMRLSDSDEAPTIIAAAEALGRTITARKQKIESKVASPTKQVTLDGLHSLQADLSKTVKDANERIDNANELLSNRKKSKESLKQEVWRYYVQNDLARELAVYEGAIKAPTSALVSLEPKLSEARDNLKNKQTELSALQSQLTSSIPTVEAINRTLKSLGFLSFSIMRLDEDDTYQLVRPNGTSASETLSEGERTLISFLYFFHNLIQTNADKTSTDPIIAVIDDPVSSLDGETLFVINLLVRRIIEACIHSSGRLAQVILLTHNAYFYKEAVFQPKGMPRGGRSFFVLTKQQNGTTQFNHYEESPIKSSYTQLWDQVRGAAKSENPEISAWLPNAMRRIIENYFHITGGLDTDTLISRIPEDERWACQALLAWYNDGSHTAPWDVDYSSLSSDATVHLKAFKLIFEASGHIAHHDMMMEDSRNNTD